MCKIPIVFKDISCPNLIYFSHSISHLAIYMAIAFAKHVLSHEYVYLDKSKEMHVETVLPVYYCTGLFISTSGISEIDCATTKTYTAERSIPIGRESLQHFLY
jgi:hypothetical protein